MSRGKANIYVCIKCPHLLTSHGLVGSVSAGPYLCRYCGCKVMQSDPTRLISMAAALRLHKGEIEDNVKAAPVGGSGV